MYLIYHFYFIVFSFVSFFFLCFIGKDLSVEKEREEYEEDSPPLYLSQHTVLPASWSYLLPFHSRTHSMSFLTNPPYHPLQSFNLRNDNINYGDRNMNTTNHNHNDHHHIKSHGRIMNDIGNDGNEDEFGLDIHSVMAMELLENAKEGSIMNGVIETRNEEVLRRVAEMQKMVESSEQYLNEHGELIHEYEMKSNLRQPWNSTSLDLDSDCESLNSSKVSSNEDAPPPGALKHSDSLVLLAEAINQDLSGITKGLNSISTNLKTEICDDNNQSQSEETPKIQRKVNGLSQLLNDLQSLGNDCSQSESDSESVNTPSTSPTHRRMAQQNGHNKAKNNAFRTSFGLHSPDGSVLGIDSNDQNLREYLRQLKEISKVDDSEEIDLAAKKLSELYGFEVGEDTIIETDPDLIDLRAIPPPQTPDELDAFSILNAAPSGFDDQTIKSEDDGDLDKFLAKVIVAPPTQKATPAKELTPEEIMSYIIPPPPNLEELENRKSIETNSSNVVSEINSEKYPKENLYSNSSNSNGTAVQHCKSNGQAAIVKENGTHVIEYPTVERKGAFSCCSKSKKDESTKNEISDSSEELKLPPRKCSHSGKMSPPARPPKSVDLQNKLNSTIKQTGFGCERKTEIITSDNGIPPVLPPRNDEICTSPPLMVGIPPKKPPLPPMPTKPILKNPHPLPRQISQNGDSPMKVAGIGSPHLHRNLSLYREIDKAFTSCPTSQIRSNGHYRSNSDCPPVCLKNPNADNRPQLSLLCSPQMSRKVQAPITTTTIFNNSEAQTMINKNGHVINGETLLAKTDIAMAGLLVKLDQVAAQCTAAQAAGGGANIDEEKFEKARDELTEQALTLVSASKLLVVAMSDPTLSSLPEHLTSCLTSIRRITELTQDMIRHTSAPLQTRNIVLKVHDVASSFRELAGVQVGPLGAGQLALQAECLANVLATLLRSLRVFSP